MFKNKKIKIVATVGPAVHAPEMIEDLARAGVDVFRLNLSHLKREGVIHYLKAIRDAEKSTGKPLTIMGDLGGLKVRVGKISDGTVLETGDTINITTEPVTGNNKLISINHPSLLNQLQAGTEILLDDGLIKLIIIKELMDNCVQAKVEAGGLLLSYKGFFAQDISLSSIGMPDKDIEDIKVMVSHGIDALAVSFVQSEHDIYHVKDKLPADSNMVIIAKIETKLAVENIESIIEASDGIMIARGDLGLAVPISGVPILQKKLIKQCLKKAKPVITATQMLESMTKSPFPTRAEVADVANAILDGTDAVMLSDETATGKYPLQTIQMMTKIIESTTPHIKSEEFHDEKEIPHAVSSAAGMIADKVGARVIIAFTRSGFSALQIARNRYPQEVIVALTPNQKTIKKLNFCWGIYPKLTSATESFDHALKQTIDFIQDNDIIKLETGEPYVIVSGLPFNRTGVTNLIQVGRAR